MKLVYFSQVSNNTTRLVAKTGLASLRIPILGEGQDADEPYILVCPTYQMAGGVPHQVRSWLEQNGNWHLMHSVIGTGNRNFAGDFGKAGLSISRDYGVAQATPTIEISGTKADVLRIKELVTNEQYALSRA